MFPNLNPWTTFSAAFVIALVVCNRMTPPVKRFAERIGAMDIPKDGRRVHDHPIPRMGGLAIIVGFFLSVLLFMPVSDRVYGIVIGAFIIAGMGFVDDIVSLRPMVKLVLQIFAALVCVRFGLVIDAVSWPVTKTYLDLGWWGTPITVLWIVLCTNAFNLIDGLDGLAAGVTSICSFFLLASSILFSTAEPAAAIILTALIGACLGFIPFNFNPARIFMGDVGSQFLGFILATASVLGHFKLQAVMTFALPLADTGFAVIRRLAHGQSPFQADKGHFHHRLMAMGLSQKQTVLVLYGVAAIGGVVSLWLAGRGAVIRTICIAAILVTLVCIAVLVFIRNPRRARARELKKLEREHEHEQENSANQS